MSQDENNTELARMVQGGQAVIRIENETMQMLAIQRPRPPIVQILKEAVEELEAVPEFAERAFYVLPFKERSDDEEAKVKKVEGLSIRAANALRRHYRNVASATRTVDETARSVTVQGAAIDLETNTRSAKEKDVSKFAVNKKTKQEYPLRPDRLQMAVDAGKSKAERNAILALLPEALKITYFNRAKEIAAERLGATGKKALPIGERRELAVKKFAELGVKEEVLFAHLKIKARTEMTEAHIGELIGIFNSINDQEMSVEEAFGINKPAQEKPNVGAEMLEAMVDKATGEIGKEAPLPEDGSVGMVNGHRELTPEEKGLALEIERRGALRRAYEAKFKALTPRFPDRLTPAEAKFKAQAISACWGTADEEAAFDTLPIAQTEAGLAKFNTLADGILKKRGAA